jgi:hypothetical protein
VNRGPCWLVIVVAVLLAGCGGSQRPPPPPEVFLGTPAAGLSYEVPDTATVAQLTEMVDDTDDGLDPGNVAVRLVLKGRRRVGAVLVLGARGSREGVFAGFTSEAEKLGAHPIDKTIAGATAKQVELKGFVITAAVERDFVLETVAKDRATGDLLLRPLVEAAATVPD